MEEIEKVIIQTENEEIIYQTEESAYQTAKIKRRLFSLSAILAGMGSAAAGVTTLLPYFIKPVNPIPKDTMESLIIMDFVLFGITIFSYLAYRGYKNEIETFERQRNYAV